MPHPLVIAHRGDSSRAPENSLEAVRLALSLGVDMIELDIRTGRDRALYVIHDRRTGRTGDRDLDIERSGPDEIASVRLANGERVPALPDVLSLVNGAAALNLEIKSAGAGARCAGLLSVSGYRWPVMISSFQAREVEEARRAAPSLSFSEIFDVFTARDLERYASKGYGIVSLRKKTATKGLIDACHDRGIKVYVWTVDAEEEMRRFIAWNADGIYTNRPKDLRELLVNAECGTK